MRLTRQVHPRVGLQGSQTLKCAYRLDAHPAARRAGEWERLSLKTALLALLLLSLTACQGFPPLSGADDAAEPDAGAGSDADAEVVSGLDTAEREQAERERRRRTPPPRPPELPIRGDLGEERLTGLTTNQTWDLLGPPSQVEEESPATVWTYDVAGCRLELFFYFDLESQQQRTLALDLEAASDFVGSRPFCWYTFAKRGRDRAAPLPQADREQTGRDSAEVPTAGELDGAAADAPGQDAPGQNAPGQNAPGQNAPGQDVRGQTDGDANAPPEGGNAQ